MRKQKKILVIFFWEKLSVFLESLHSFLFYTKIPHKRRPISLLMCAHNTTLLTPPPCTVSSWFTKTDNYVLLQQSICPVRTNPHNYWTNDAILLFFKNIFPGKGGLGGRQTNAHTDKHTRIDKHSRVWRIIRYFNSIWIVGPKSSIHIQYLVNTE